MRAQGISAHRNASATKSKSGSRAAKPSSDARDKQSVSSQANADGATTIDEPLPDTIHSTSTALNFAAKSAAGRTKEKDEPKLENSILHWRLPR